MFAQAEYFSLPTSINNSSTLEDQRR